MLTTFVGPCPKGHIVRHFPDFNPSNVSLSNLQWASRSQNELDKRLSGNSNDGEKNGQAKLTKEMVRLIRYSTESQKALAERFGVNCSQISRVKGRKTWKGV